MFHKTVSINMISLYATVLDLFHNYELHKLDIKWSRQNRKFPLMCYWYGKTISWKMLWLCRHILAWDWWFWTTAAQRQWQILLLWWWWWWLLPCMREFWGTVWQFIPHLRFFRSESSRSNLFHSLGQDQSTVAQRAETTVIECSLRSCLWARFLTGSHSMPGQRHSQPTLTSLGQRCMHVQV